jgi:hypothetical protein
MRTPKIGPQIGTGRLSVGPDSPYIDRQPHQAIIEQCDKIVHASSVIASLGAALAIVCKVLGKTGTIPSIAANTFQIGLYTAIAAQINVVHLRETHSLRNATKQVVGTIGLYGFVIVPALISKLACRVLGSNRVINFINSQLLTAGIVGVITTVLIARSIKNKSQQLF